MRPQLGPAASTALRMLHAATCTPTTTFKSFLFEVFQRDPDLALPLDHRALRDISPWDVLGIIRARQAVPADEPWVMLMCLDEFNKGLFEGPVASIGDPAMFMTGIVSSLGSLLSSGDATPVRGGLPRTTVVAYLASSMPGVVATGGIVFRPNGQIPRHIPLFPLSPAECAAVCEAQPELRVRWRTLREFRRLMDALRGWPRALEALVEAACAELESRGPGGADWEKVYGAVEEHVRVGLMSSPKVAAAIICTAMLATPVYLKGAVPSPSEGGEVVTWEKVVELGAAMLVPDAAYPSTHVAVVTGPYIQSCLRRTSMAELPPELRALKSLYANFPALSSAPGDAALSDAEFGALVASWEAARPELLGGLTSMWQTPRKERRIEIGDYYSAARCGLAPADGFEVYSYYGRATLFKLEMEPPAEAQCALQQVVRQFPQHRAPLWDNGHVHHNVAGASIGDYWRVLRCRDPLSGLAVEVLVVGRIMLCATKDLLSAKDAEAEYVKVAAAFTSSDLGARFAGRWLLVLHATARAAFDPAALPLNVVLIDGDSVEKHMGPVLSSALRLVIRGRKANANTSNRAELMLVDGVSGEVADAVLTTRTAGGFLGWADLCERVPLVSALPEEVFQF